MKIILWVEVDISIVQSGNACTTLTGVLAQRPNATFGLVTELCVVVGLMPPSIVSAGTTHEINVIVSQVKRPAPERLVLGSTLIIGERAVLT
jgi:hypothetical protein